MGIVVLLVVLALGCVLQGALPSVEVLAGARWPLLSVVALYYCLYRSRAYAIAAAFAAGLMVDSLSLMPFGVSLVLYFVGAMAVYWSRSLVNGDSVWVLCGMGGIVSFFLTLVTGWWLVRHDLIAMSAVSVWSRAFGTGVLGLLVSPPAIAVIRWLDHAAEPHLRRGDAAGI